MKSKEYIKEYKKQNGIDDLNRIKKRLDILIKNCSNRKKMDNETKQNIISLYESFMEIFDNEIDKELSKQKKDGKEFISFDDYEKHLDKILKDEL